jgi:hypothetical protein
LCCHGNPKYNPEWGFHQLREVWTKTFKRSAVSEDDVEENDVEMTVEGGTSSVGAPADESVFEKQMNLNNEANTEQLRDSTSPRYVKTQDLDQLEEWMKENIGLNVYQDTLMSTKRTRMSLGCGDSSMVALYLETG